MSKSPSTFYFQERKKVLNFDTGVLTQFAIVVGIMTTQALGLRLATPRTWRWVLTASAVLSAVQGGVSFWIQESPVYLARHKKVKDATFAARKLWGATAPAVASQDG